MKMWTAAVWKTRRDDPRFGGRGFGGFTTLLSTIFMWTILDNVINIIS